MLGSPPRHGHHASAFSLHHGVALQGLAACQPAPIQSLNTDWQGNLRGLRCSLRAILLTGSRRLPRSIPNTGLLSVGQSCQVRAHCAWHMAPAANLRLPSHASRACAVRRASGAFPCRDITSALRHRIGLSLQYQRKASGPRCNPATPRSPRRVCVRPYLVSAIVDCSLQCAVCSTYKTSSCTVYANCLCRGCTIQRTVQEACRCA